MGKRNFGLNGSLGAYPGSIRVIGGMTEVSQYLIEATQKFDHRVQFPLRGPVDLGHKLLLALKSGDNLVIGDGNRVGQLPLKPLGGAISVGLLSQIGADFPFQVQAPRLQSMAQTTVVIADHALGHFFIGLRDPDVRMRFQTST